MEAGHRLKNLPSFIPGVLAHLGASNEGEGAYSMMARPRNETIIILGLAVGPVSS